MIEKKLNKVFQSAWDEGLCVKGIILDKSHEKDVKSISENKMKTGFEYKDVYSGFGTCEVQYK